MSQRFGPLCPPEMMMQLQWLIPPKVHTRLIHLKCRFLVGGTEVPFKIQILRD
jgi:hypothetical protein